MHDKGSKGVCKRWRCAMHGKCTCGARRVKYTTNEPNIFLMRKHERPQSLVLIRVQISEKMPKRHFIKYLVCTLWITKWNNAWTWWIPPLIHVLFAIKGPTSKTNHLKKPIPYKNLTKKISFSQPLW